MDCKMKNKVLIFLTVFLSLFLMNNASAFMPLEHYISVEQAISSNNSIGTDFYNACNSYPDLCLASSMEVDIGVIWYYTASGKYGALHSPTFCKEILDNVAKVPGSDPNKMKACAVGACLHAGPDLVSHSDGGLVQYCISHTFLPNSVAHVFCEQHLDNWVRSKDTYAVQQYKTSLLNGYLTCEPLYIQAMQGDSAFAGMSKSQLESTFDTFVQEIVNSQTGYDTGFKDKSLFVSIKSIPYSILIPYILVMLSFLMLSILLIFKVFRRQFKIRHIFGLIIFIPLFLVMAYLFYGALNGNAFNNFITVIKPISNFFPIGDPQSYMTRAVENNQQILANGEKWLEGKDWSGMGTNPVLIQASNNVAYFYYIIMVLLIIVLGWFIWYLFKKNKISINNTFGSL